MLKFYVLKVVLKSEVALAFTFKSNRESVSYHNKYIDVIKKNQNCKY